MRTGRNIIFLWKHLSKLGLETHTQVAHLLLQRKLRFSGKCFSVDTWARYRPLKQVFSIPPVSKRCASTVNADEITNTSMALFSNPHLRVSISVFQFVLNQSRIAYRLLVLAACDSQGRNSHESLPLRAQGYGPLLVGWSGIKAKEN